MNEQIIHILGSKPFDSKFFYTKSGIVMMRTEVSSKFVRALREIGLTEPKDFLSIDNGPYVAFSFKDVSVGSIAINKLYDSQFNCYRYEVRFQGVVSLLTSGSDEAARELVKETVDGLLRQL